MAEHTTNYELIKPEETDPILLGQINENMDKIDAVLAEKVDKSPGKGLSANDFTDAEKQKLLELENYNDTGIKSEAALNRSTLGYQRKNLLKNTAETTTKSGITFTVNNDGSVTANGTTADGQWAVLTFPVNAFKSGKYVLSGRSKIGNTSSYMYLSLWPNGISSNSITLAGGDNVEFTLTEATNFIARVSVPPSTTVTDTTVYPMIRCAEITDDTYEPYKPSVEERLAALEAAITGGGEA